MKPSPELLRKLMRYEPDTGKLFWIERTQENFPSAKPGALRMWNLRMAGRPALNYSGHRGYLVGSFKPHTLTAHRVAWAIHYGEHPVGQVDHINGNRQDNRISNLRDVTNAENARNIALSKLNTSGVPGVYLHKQTNKWCAQIAAFGRTVSIGLFEEFGDAVIARKAAERVLSYHPNHGRPNITQDAVARLRGET